MVDFWQGKRIFVSGGSGFLGQHVVRLLQEAGASVFVPRSLRYDLTHPLGVEQAFLTMPNPDVLFHLAAVVGGIGANQRYPADFYHQNVLMNTLVLEAARVWKVSKVVAVGTVCMYPKFTSVPFRESDLWLGYPEETNAPYGIAKRGLLTHCQSLRQEYNLNCIFLIPTNLYGPCFTGDTEVMTPAGTKSITDFHVGDSVYTLNPETNNVELGKVTAVQHRKTNELFSLSSKSVDFKVSPEHKIYYRTSTGFQLETVETFRERVGRPYGMIRLARHIPIEADVSASKFSETFSLLPYLDEKHLLDGDYVRDFPHSKSKKFPVSYKTYDIVEFLGWFISEGCVTKPTPKQTTHGQVRISQSIRANPEYHKEIAELLDRMNLPFGFDDHACYFSSRLFKNFIDREVGNGSETKRIPDFIFDEAFPTKWRRLLFDTLMKGDGDRTGGRYTTKSEFLKDGMVRLCFLLGYRAIARHDGQLWRINIQTGNRNPSVKYRDMKIEQVNTDVFCITTDKNHIIFAGRNGKLNWVGQCDNFNPDTSHVIPALLRKFHEAKEANAPTVEVWGSGSATRDFLYVEDCARALLLAAEHYDAPDPVNLGTGVETSIDKLSQAIKGLTTYTGVIQYNQAKPDGQPRRVLDISRAREAFGWWATTPLKEGLHSAYRWYLEKICLKSVS